MLQYRRDSASTPGLGKRLVVCFSMLNVTLEAKRDSDMADFRRHCVHFSSLRVNTFCHHHVPSFHHLPDLHVPNTLCPSSFLCF